MRVHTQKMERNEKREKKVSETESTKRRIRNDTKLGIKTKQSIIQYCHERVITLTERRYWNDIDV